MLTCLSLQHMAMVDILVIAGFLSLPFDATEPMIQTRQSFFVVQELTLVVQQSGRQRIISSNTYLPIPCLVNTSLYTPRGS